MDPSMKPPAWLNKEYFYHALSGFNKPQVTILNYKISPGLGVGQNFCSRVYKVNVIYREDGQKNKEKNLFIKMPIEEGEILNVINDARFYESEVLMYTELFPTMEKLVGKLDFVVQTYPSKEEYTLIFEDVSKEGYVMGEKEKRLDFKHCKEALKILAKFHASTVALNKQSPDLVASVGEPVFKKRDQRSNSFMEEKFEDFYDIIQTWKGYERYVNIIKESTEQLWERLEETFSRRETINVLNHGDFWTHNILFKHNTEGEIEKVKLIDYQMCVYGSIGIDIHYFTWTSMQHTVQANRLPELYLIYLKALNQYLREFQCVERVTEEEFKKEMEFTQFYAIFTMVYNCNVMYSPKYISPDDENKSSRDYKKQLSFKICNGEFFKPNIDQGLKYLEKNGFFRR
uniref:CHK kinase-like domain-containing protein n=1 Tax=Clastoptera arizonana TaxID=38151 RepID=A0A1B6CL31_9HEMI